MARQPQRWWQARVALPALGLALVGVACTATSGPPGSGSPEGRSLEIVTTTTVLGDVARNVVGNDGTVEVLVPIGVDPHEFTPSARQIAAVREADLVIANGLLLEERLADVLESIASDGANVLTLGDLVDPLPLGEDAEGALDPHVWFDPLRMADAARVIAAELDVVAPGVPWSARAESYAAELLAADAAIVEVLESIPAGRRKLVTNHDALGYFADRYGFAVVGVVVPGGSTLSEPSSATLADLVETIARENVTVIFAEQTESVALAEAVAAEIGTDVEVVELYTGSLGEAGSGADTLIGMLVTNAGLIADALS
ncbi:MAG: metal ABC transporter substrate-binding protein [Acidimicrobiia bacterium]